MAHRSSPRRGRAGGPRGHRLAGAGRGALLSGQLHASPWACVRRRQIMVDRRAVVAVGRRPLRGSEGEPGPPGSAGGDALLAELERARTGEMLDIVATIQAEQDEIIRAPLDRLLTVQGGPGTGKTAVGLHRAAFLLYNHPTLESRRRARARPEPGLSSLHRPGPPLARRGGRRADHHRRHRPQGQGPRRRDDGGPHGSRATCEWPSCSGAPSTGAAARSNTT